jgi:hypothetical protein
MQEAATLLNLASWDPGLEDFVASALSDNPEAFMMADSMISLSTKRDLEDAIESLNSALRKASKGVARISNSGATSMDDFSVSSIAVIDTEDEDEDEEEDSKDEKDKDDKDDESEESESKSSSPISFR